jgi:hypothetical protein
MSQHREYLRRQLEDAERELDSAKKLSEITSAARKRRLALEALRWLDEQKRKERRASRGRASGDASS